MSKSFRLLSFILLSVIFCSHLFSQEVKPDHKLLWEITGNGLSGTSYLYGTIHIQDKRVFDFSDSVLLALESCKTFAMEVHPDSAVRAAFQRHLKRGAKKNRLSKESIRKWLNEDEYDSLSTIFLKKTGLELGQFEYETPWALEEMLRDDYKGAKDKETFLDAYLGQIARFQGKRIVGLESYHEQLESSRDADGQKEREKLLGLLAAAKDEKSSHLMEDFMLEKLIEMYEEGRIDQIMHYYEMYAEQPGGLRYIDYMLLRRNRRMYTRMLPEMHKQPTFTAVGTAHLPGDGGLIDLLKNGGYQVRPVTALFTGLAEKYKMPKVDIPWQTYVNEGYGYSLQMPQKPFNYTKNEAAAASMVLYPELGTGLVYMTMSMTQIESEKNENKALEKIVSRMCEPDGQTLIKSKKIRIGGYKGRDIWIKSNKEGFIRTQIILRDQFVYLNMLESQLMRNLKGSRAKRFFNSLQFHEIPAQKWTDFTSSVGAFGIKSPGVPQQIIKEVGMYSDQEAKTKLHVFVTSDQESGNTYIFRYHDMPAGHFIPDQQVYISASANSLLQDMGATLLHTEYKSFNGFPAQYIQFNLNNRPGAGLVCARDNRLYILFALQYEEEPQKDIDDFLNSFRLLPYQHAEWKTYTAPDSSFRTSLPGNIITAIDSNQYYFQYPRSLVEHAYTAVDTNSGMSFSIYQNTYSPYFSFYDADSFYTQVLSHYEFEENDSIVSEKNLTWNNVPIKEVVLQSEDYSFTKRLRLIPWENKLYVVWALLSRESLYADEIEDFFKGVELKPQSEAHLFKTREEIRDKMLAEIQEVNGEQRKVLDKSLRYFDWQSKDLSFVYAAIKTLEIQSDSSAENSLAILIDGIGRLEDENISDFLFEQYDQLKERASLKTQILSSLASRNQPKIWKEIIRILATESTTYIHPYPSALFYSLQFEGIGYTSEIFPEVLRLAEVPSYRQQVFRLLYGALEKEVLTINQVRPFLPQLKNYLKDCIANWRDEQNLIHPNGLYELCLLWQYLDLDDSTEELIRQLQKGYQPYLHFAAVNVFLAHQLMPDTSAIYALAQDPYYRQDLYGYLDSLNHLTLFPDAYKTPRAMSETSLLNYLLEEEAWEPDTLIFMGSKKIQVQGTSGIVHIYKMGYQYEEKQNQHIEWYPAISGIFPNQSAIKPQNSTNWMSWDVWEEKLSKDDIITKWKEERGDE